MVGCAAGFLNVPKIKGTHTAMKSGMIAAENAFNALKDQTSVSESENPTIESIDMVSYQTAMESSWVFKELYEVRNIRPSFHSPLGIYGGVLYSGLDTLFLKGKVPFTFQHSQPDHASLKPKHKCPSIDYPKPDGKISFDLLENVARTGTNHSHDQPSHLKTADPLRQVMYNLPIYDGPEAKFCPAGVYEYVDSDTSVVTVTGEKMNKKFQINAQNCIHCKTCDIKDPSQNITWTTPHGGEGPNYVLT